MQIFGLVLAGGQGLRMGGADKALLPFAGAPLALRLRDRMEPQVDRLAISANGDAARLGFLGLPVLPDQASRGPLSGVLAGLVWAAAGGASHLATAAVDLPFLPGDLVARLVLAGDGGAAYATAPDRDHPTCALWPVALAAPLAEFLNSPAKPRLRDFLTAQRAVAAPFPDTLSFANLNTPEDLARAEALA